MPWLLLALVACTGEDPEPANASAVFGSFQQALQRRDEAGCRSLLTRESAAALAEMPWDRIAAQAPLQIRGARRQGNEFRVEVAEASSPKTTGEYVVVREYGRLVVDLVASAGLTAEFREATAGSDTLEPRELSPQDLDRIRLHELAQPPR